MKIALTMLTSKSKDKLGATAYKIMKINLWSCIHFIHIDIDRCACWYKLNFTFTYSLLWKRCLEVDKIFSALFWCLADFDLLSPPCFQQYLHIYFCILLGQERCVLPLCAQILSSQGPEVVLVIFCTDFLWFLLWLRMREGALDIYSGRVQYRLSPFIGNML